MRFIEMLHEFMFLLDIDIVATSANEIHVLSLGRMRMEQNSTIRAIPLQWTKQQKKVEWALRKK